MKKKVNFAREQKTSAMIIPDFRDTPVVKGKDAIRILKELENPTPVSCEEQARLAKVSEWWSRQQANYAASE
jgi:hypothetical protein